MKELNKLFFVLALVALISCKKEEKQAHDDSEIRDRYFRLENIGWKSAVHTQKVDDINFTAIEIPVQYYLLKDQGNQNLFTIDSIYEQNKTERIIEFSFRQDEEKDLLQDEFTKMTYEQAVKYMSFGLDKDFYAVTSHHDTIRCNGVSYERNFKVAPFQKVLLFFSGIDPKEKIHLVYKDYLFRKGTLKFRFKDNYTEIAL